MSSVIKRSVATNLAKAIRDSKLTNKDELTKFLASFFKHHDGFFRDDIFIAVATNKLANDPAIKNPKGNNQWHKT